MHGSYVAIQAFKEDIAVEFAFHSPHLSCCSWFITFISNGIWVSKMVLRRFDHDLGIENGFEHVLNLGIENGLGGKLDSCDSSKSRKISGVATLVRFSQIEISPQFLEPRNHDPRMNDTTREHTVCVLSKGEHNVIMYLYIYNVCML